MYLSIRKSSGLLYLKKLLLKAKQGNSLCSLMKVFDTNQAMYVLVSCLLSIVESQKRKNPIAQHKRWLNHLCFKWFAILGSQLLLFVSWLYWLFHLYLFPCATKQCGNLSKSIIKQTIQNIYKLEAMNSNQY